MISIDSLGSKSLFSLPQGYSFVKDTTVSFLIRFDTIPDTVRSVNGHDTLYVRDSLHPVFIDSVVHRPGALTLLDRASMTYGGSWLAGKVAGSYIPKGLDITGRVLDHVDTLIMPSMYGVRAASYGETFMVRYSHERTKDSLLFPIFWKVYYARGRGPVLIEEYLDSTASSTGKLSLQSQAVLKNP